MQEEPHVTIPESFLRKIEKKVADLKTIIELSTIISSKLELQDLMTVVMERAKSELEAEACSILLYNRETDKLEFEVALCQDESTSTTLRQKITLDMGQGIAGWVALNRKPLIIDDVRSDSRFFQEADKVTGFTTRSLIALPLVGRGGLIGVVEMLNPGREYDAEMFDLLSRQFAIAIENALYHRESIERERLRQELEIASALQKSFLPGSPVLRKGKLTVSGLNFPAAKVGGDIYDFIEPADGKVGILIGDVSGKGISAALYMAKFMSDFRYMAHQTDSPGATLDRLYPPLSEAPRGMFLTATYMVITLATGTARISVAGHPPFLSLRQGEVRVMDLPAGPPLGIMPADYPVTERALSEGERLILLTDGVFEARNREGERIGFHSIVEFVKRHGDKDELAHRIVDYVDSFSKGTERADDLTVVDVRWSG
jgi:sigma-B regulation protein RsbU (phosphoserine phosphatase)